MKRLFLAIAAATLPFAASASPQLATDWGVKASDLYQETVDFIENVDRSGETAIPAEYETEIVRFAHAAAKLGSWIDGNNGPSDLGCIFRGMAQEGEVQLDALYDAQSPVQTRESLVRLATMFSDAEIIAVAAVYSADHDTPAAPAGIVASCPVSPASSFAALGD
ncbi:hypothetical protein WNY37_13285 [Henriciella sp. AS95]|uniref:hypothetical protein n=1 Tax=Henriciella sp. AS95 TaxID=3135782 RepID=UPI00317A9DFA